MTIKAVIVDDERLARVELKHLLGQMKDGPAIKVVGEAANVDDAVTLIEGQAVDLVFLDIQMPGKNGFELLEMLTTCPTVIFTTAYDEYAIKAFAANALDYLLKPIEPERLQQALGKAADVDSKPTPEEDSQERMAINDKVFIKDGEKCFFVPVADVIAFASIGNYCRVIFPGGQPMIRKTLQQLEDRLPAEPLLSCQPPTYYQPENGHLGRRSHVRQP